METLWKELRQFQQYMISDGWVWVGVFILVSLLQGRKNPAYAYLQDIGIKYFN